MILDMLRASKKSNGLSILKTEITDTLKEAERGEQLLASLEQLFSLVGTFESLERDELESTAKPVFEKLTDFYKLTLLHQQLNDKTKGWVQPAIGFFTDKLLNTAVQKRTPLTREEVDALIAWEY